jgi:hypothetical protein
VGVPGVAGMRAEAAKIRAALAGRADSSAARDTLARLRADPTLPFGRLGMVPDPWQVEFLEACGRRESLLCCRQAGKSTVTAARVVREALLYPFSDCLVFSPTMRQSMELLRKVMVFYRGLGAPVAATAATKTGLELANGSRVISLPDSQQGVVGFSAPRLVVIDEGSRVSDELYASVRPMLATGKGSLLTLSTPFGNEGWFFHVWDDSAEGVARRAKLNEPWRRTAVSADRVTRITPEFLADERVELGDRWFQQEYYLRFLDSIDAVWGQSVIHGARADGIEPLFDLGA